VKKHQKLIYFLFLSGIASFFNYAVYPVLARILSDDEFIKITVALAVFTQLSSFMLSIVALTIGLSKQENTQTAKIIVEKLQAVLTHLFIIIVAVFLVSSPLFLDQLKIPSSMLLPICAMLALSIPLSIINGYLNGTEKLIKLGLVLVMTATLQFFLSITFGSLTKSGAVTLNAMSLGTLLAIILAYILYKNDNLPNVTSVFNHKFELYRSKEMRSIILYTVFVSLTTLITNILMVVDLLVVNSRQTDAKAYADLYIVSRVVFFSGMLFVWPFLSNLNISNRSKNKKSFWNLFGIFFLISAVSIVAMAIFGQQITGILLGASHETGNDIKTLSILAILYKFIFLIIISIVLFFIVMRSYWAVVLPIVLAITTGIFIMTTNSNTTTMYLVFGLNIISTFVMLIGIYGFYRTNKVTSKS
jgi:O-antigen/teichoic acid export membrane protein